MNIFNVDTGQYENIEGVDAKAFQGLTRRERAIQLGNHYSFFSRFNAPSNGIVVYLQNDNEDSPLHLTRVLVSAEKRTTLSFFIANADATGTEDIGIINWNTSLSNPPQATALSNASQPTGAVQIGSVHLTDDSVFEFQIADLLLFEGKALYIQTSAMGTVETTITGFFE